MGTFRTVSVKEVSFDVICNDLSVYARKNRKGHRFSAAFLVFVGFSRHQLEIGRLLVYLNLFMKKDTITDLSRAGHLATHGFNIARGRDETVNIDL